VLTVADIHVSFDGRVVLDSVSVEVATGEVVALLGPSGSGKSTLLRVVAGLVTPTRGRVLIDGADVTALATHRRSVGMVFQDNQLFPHLTVGENVAFGPRMHGVGRAERSAIVADSLALVGLAGFERRSVDRLSGGEAKRVALARSLAVRPAVLLLDEPLTGLDEERHDELAVALANALRSTRTTALLVTHDLDEAAAVADRSVRLADLEAGSGNDESRPSDRSAP
jgi:thiamine transport system ATP-binding protein